MHHRSILAAVLVSAALLAPASSGRAQGAAPELAPVAAAEPTPVATPAPEKPLVSSARAGVSPAPRVKVVTTDAPEPVQRQTSRENGRLLTFIGAGLFLAGIIMDDDAGTVIAIAGLGIGIFGILNWLQ